MNVAVAAAQKSGGFSGYVDSTKITFYFHVGSAAIDLDYSSNNAMLEKLRKVQEKQGADSIYVPRVDVFAGVSPEGSDEANSQVRWKRLDNSIHLIERYFQLPRYNENYFDAKVTIPQIWQNLSRELKQYDFPNRERVLQCIESGGNVPAKIQAIDRTGNTWNSIANKFFPILRRCEVVIYFKKKEKKDFPEMDKLLPEEEIVFVKRSPKDELPSEKPIEEPKEEKKRPRRTTITVYEPFLAINSNLLYDLALAPNLGVEVPVKDRLSFNVSYVFPWWVDKDEDNWCYQLQYWELEGKYWLGDRDYVEKLTGHAVGLFAGVGFYDLEWDSKGYQGEICINAGVSYHYAIKLGKEKRWRLQFGAGAGMMRTNYSYYEHKFNHLVWERDGRYTWFGPTKLDISLGYVFHRKVVKPRKLPKQEQQEGGDDAIKE